MFCDVPIFVHPVKGDREARLAYRNYTETIRIGLAKAGTIALSAIAKAHATIQRPSRVPFLVTGEGS